MKVGYDSVAMSAAEWRRIVPPNPEVIGVYGNGRFANHTVAREAFPHAICLVYDVNGSLPSADIRDLEPGNGGPDQAGVWAKAHDAHHGPHTLPHPALYASASSVSAVVSNMLDHGYRRDGFLVQSAHYGRGQHLCGPGCGFPQADSTQWDDHGAHGENTDRTIYEDHFFAPPKPKHNPHYELFDNTKRAIFAKRTERETVQEYDRWRATQTHANHPHRARLFVLRLMCASAARRLKRLGNLGSSHRAWRTRELQDRAAGKRLV